MKLQAAMEYLSTYGWAILIIVIAILGFYELGIFNSYTYAPKATTGSCSVNRVSVAGLSRYSLVGPCKNEIPEYVLNIQGEYYINYISIPSTSSDSFNGPITISFWIRVVNTTPACLNGFLQKQAGTSAANYWYYLDINSATGGCGLRNPAAVYPLATDNGVWGVNVGGSNVAYNMGNPALWYSVIWSYNYSTGGTLYINGVEQGGAGGGGPLGQTTAPILINAAGNDYELSNLQIYNTSLSSAEVQSLYSEGIGGIPTDIPNLAGWWPLNGNANDYSGNGNNGKSYGSVSFVSNWETGYTAP